jgi:hypothetical protein
MLISLDKRVLLVVILSILSIIYNIHNLSISYKESLIVFDDNSFIHYFSKFFLDTFGFNDYSLRLPFLFFHIINIFLFYDIGKKVLKKESDISLLILLYSLTPAVYSVSLLVNSSIIVIFCTLLFIKYHLEDKKNIQILLMFIFLFIDNSFVVFYVAIGIFFILDKNHKLAFYSFLCFLLSSYIFGFDSGGKPKGHFLDTILIYALMFSVFMFFILFYTLYRNFIKDKKDIIWYIGAIPFIASILISFRQKIMFEDFTPFVIISLILVVKYYYSSLRVRLKEFQSKIKIIYNIAFIVMFLTTFIIAFNRNLFFILENPKNHFLYKYYIAKELSFELKKNNIYDIFVEDEKLSQRLRFYGINSSKKIKLLSFESIGTKKIDIYLGDKYIQSYFISK